MSGTVSQTIIVGNVGQDPEVRYMPSGGPVCNLSVATTETWTDKQTGQKQEETEWHRVVLFNRLAEIAGEYVRKGSKVCIIGKNRTRKWQDQSGADRYSTEIRADRMQMISNPQNQQGGHQGQQQGNYHQGQQQGNYQQGQQRGNYQQGRGNYQQGQPQGGPQGQPPPMDETGDDIPF